MDFWEEGSLSSVCLLTNVTFVSKCQLSFPSHKQIVSHTDTHTHTRPQSKMGTVELNYCNYLKSDKILKTGIIHYPQSQRCKLTTPLFKSTFKCVKTHHRCHSQYLLNKDEAQIDKIITHHPRKSWRTTFTSSNVIICVTLSVSHIAEEEFWPTLLYITLLHRFHDPVCTQLQLTGL